MVVNIFGFCDKVWSHNLSVSFASDFALVRGILGLLVLILVPVLGPGLTKRPLFLLLELRRFYEFVGCSSVDTEMNINTFILLAALAELI